ncbi:acyl-[ACP]--phospholipid O-acyltransferase, partial [Streptomyces sp. WAC04770]
VVTLFLIVFSVAIALGSMLVNRLLRGEVSARHVPISALAMAVFMLDLWWATRSFVVVTPHADIAQFVATPGSWRILFDLTGMAVAGGMFIVPLYAILQTRSPPEGRSRAIAANNIVNAAVMVAVVAVATALLAAGVSIPGIIGTMGFATLAVALISCLLLPDT